MNAKYDRSVEIFPSLRHQVTPAASLRVPVTLQNRALLRLLRAVESSAWEEANGKSHRPLRIRVRKFSCQRWFRVNITGQGK